MFNPGGNTSYAWHYAPHHQDRTLELYGTVVAMQEKQGRDYNPNKNEPGKPSTWPDGKPKMNIRIAFADPNGELKTIEFGMAGKEARAGKKFSLHMEFFKLSGGNMANLIGKTLHIWTWDVNPVNNAPWGQGNPRQFGMELVEGVTYELASPLPSEFLVEKLYCDDGAQGGQPIAAAPQQIQTPQVQGGYYAAPTTQPQIQQTYAPQPTMAPVAQQMAPAPQAVAPQQQQVPMGVGAPMPQAQPMQTMAPMPAQVATAPMPQGMDPAVAQAMQAVGVANVQPVAEVYDDIPFE